MVGRQLFQTRESRDSPIAKAFCRVAPSVRLRTLAITPAGLFFRARDFNLPTCTGVQDILLVRFFTCIVSNDENAATCSRSSSLSSAAGSSAAYTTRNQYEESIISTWRRNPLIFRRVNIEEI